jgi:penicillin-binding protein 1A
MKKKNLSSRQHRNQKKSSFLKKFLRTLCVFFIWIGIAIGLSIIWFAQELPDLNNFNAHIRNPSITIQTQNGEIIATYGDYFDGIVYIKDLPAYVPQVIMAVEDRRFYSHFGLDIIGLVRAAYNNYKAKRVVQGGSTITQQLAKNFLISQGVISAHDRSYKRKIQELLLALWLEWHFKKDDIFTLYLNRVYLGAGTYGIEAASQKYFNKSARYLTVFEAAVIAGLLKAPSKYCPSAHPKEAKNRAKVALDLMEDAGFLKDSHKYLNEGMHQFETYEKNYDRYIGARFFCDWIVEDIPNYVHIDQDLIVVVTLDPFIQKCAEDACEQGLKKFGKTLNTQEMAFVAMTHDGAVKAMVGGHNYKKSQYNRAVQAKRQPGSAFKIFVYAAAMDSGMDPQDMIDSSPFHQDNWHPSNYKWRETGPVTIETAFLNSINSVSIRLTEALSPKRVISMAKKMGITQRLDEHISIALGSIEVTLLDLVSSMATFINKGYAVWNYGIMEIRNKKGTILYTHKSPSITRVITDDGLKKMKLLLRACVERGSGRAANVSADVAGKTGSNGDKDIWFIGYQDPQYDTSLAIGVWAGNDKNQKLAKIATGGRGAAPVVGYFLNDLKNKNKDIHELSISNHGVSIDDAFADLD